MTKQKAPPHRIILTLQDDGTMAAKVEGIAGPGCAGATHWLHALGKVVADRNTAEFYRMGSVNDKDGRVLKAGGTW